MSELKYDSLYSALKALNVALGGDEINDADSTYTVIERLSETLGLSEQTPMLLSAGEGSECPTTSIDIGANGEYNIDETTGFVGWNQVNVNIPNFEIPGFEVISYTETVNFGDPFEFVAKCQKKNYIYSFFSLVDSSMLFVTWDQVVIGEDNEWQTIKFTSSKGIQKSDYFNITGWGLNCINNIQIRIPFSYNMNLLVMEKLLIYLKCNGLKELGVIQIKL